MSSSLGIPVSESQGYENTALRNKPSFRPGLLPDSWRADYTVCSPPPALLAVSQGFCLMQYKLTSVPAGDKITMTGGKLQVPDRPIVPFIEGDGTGPDIWRASV